MASIIVKSETVISMADKMIGLILESRRQRDEKKIADATRSHENHVRLFGWTRLTRPMSREEIVAWIERNDYCFPSEWYRTQERECRKLRSLAKLSPDALISINEDDIDNLGAIE